MRRVSCSAVRAGGAGAGAGTDADADDRPQRLNRHTPRPRFRPGFGRRRVSPSKQAFVQIAAQAIAGQRIAALRHRGLQQRQRHGGGRYVVASTHQQWVTHQATQALPG